jgi:hypothetical protein
MGDINDWAVWSLVLRPRPGRAQLPVLAADVLPGPDLGRSTGRDRRAPAWTSHHDLLRARLDQHGCVERHSRCSTGCHPASAPKAAIRLALQT